MPAPADLARRVVARLLPWLGAVAIAAPRLVTGWCSDSFYDERTVVDLGRLALSPCTQVGHVPWDQPPLPSVSLYLVQALAERLGLDAGVAMDLPLLLGRLLVTLAPVLAWLMLRRALPAGFARQGFFAVCLLSAGSREMSSLAMNNGIVALPVVLALAALARPRPRWLLGGLALALAVASAWVAWPAAVGLGLGALPLLRRDPRPRRAALALVAPSALVGAAWLTLSFTQGEWFHQRLELYRGVGAFDPLVLVVSTQARWLVGRVAEGDSLLASLAAVGTVCWLALAAVGARRDHGDSPAADALRVLSLGLAAGTWLVVIALIPIVWMGKAKYFVLLLVPTAALAARGLGAALSARGRGRWAGVSAGVAVAVALSAGLARSPTCWDRSEQKRRFYLPTPASWTCASPWEPGLQRAQDLQGLLPPTGPIVCEGPRPCVVPTSP